MSASKPPCRKSAPRRLRVADGDVLLASWRVEGASASAWLVGHDTVMVTAPTLQAAVGALHQRVIELTDHVEYTFEFTPPLPDDVDGDDPDAGIVAWRPTTPVATPEPEVVADWRQLPDGTFHLWCVDHPAIAVENSLWLLGKAELHSAVSEALGFWPAITFLTPSPVKPRQTVPWAALRAPDTAAYRWIGGEGSALFTNAPALFTGGPCQHCKRPIGQRSDVPLALSSFDRGYHGLLAKDDLGRWWTIRLFSEGFLDSLTSAERDQLTLRRAELSQRRAQQFYEVVGVTPEVSPARLPGADPLKPACDVCGSPPGWAYDVDDARSGKRVPMLMVLASTLPPESRAMFGLTTGSRVELCFRADRWADLAKQKASKGIKSHQLGILRG